MKSQYVRRVEFDGGHIEVVVVRRRRKTMAIHVFPDRPVELRAPLKCAWSAIDEFLASRREWILDSIRSLAGAEVPGLLRYVEGENHYYLGTPLALQLGEGQNRRVSLMPGAIAVRCRAPDDANDVKKALERFYRKEALRLLPGRVELCMARFREPLPNPSLSVRKMQARWGSCSTKGEICLNSMLMQKPMEAIDFVVTHELCHLRHFEHNKSFYRLMDRVMPDWREREKLLARSDATVQRDLF